MSIPLEDESLNVDLEKDVRFVHAVDAVTKLSLAKVAENALEVNAGDVPAMTDFMANMLDASTVAGKRNRRFLEPIIPPETLYSISDIDALLMELSNRRKSPLPDIYKQRLTLFFAGASYGEIAAMTGSTEKSVSVTLSKLKSDMLGSQKSSERVSASKQKATTKKSSAPSRRARLNQDEDFGDSFSEGLAVHDNNEDEVEELLDKSLLTDDPVRDFLRKIGRHPLLTAVQEVEHAKAIEVGVFAHEKLDQDESLSKTEERELMTLTRYGEKSFEVMVVSNQRLVVNIAKRYTGRGIPLLDLIQDGNEGLIRAVQKFDYTQGFKFSTYATWWIRQAITRGIADRARLIRIPVHAVEAINKISMLERSLLVELGREPTDYELARELNVTIEKLKELRTYRDQVPVSINMKLGEDKDDEFGDIIADGNLSDPTDGLEDENLAKHLAKYIDALPEREREVIRLRFGLVTGEPATLDKIGEMLGLTRERVRQIEAKAMRKIKAEALYDQTLRDYLD